MITADKTLVLLSGNFAAPVDAFEAGSLDALRDIYTSRRIFCNQTATPEAFN